MSVTRSHSIKRFFLFPSIVLAVVLFAEFPVRFAWSFFPHQVDIEDSSYIIPDPILDHVMQPGGDSGALDKNGYRNTEPLATYDVVAIGDSMTEGSETSWPRELSLQTGMSVYNMGVRGYGTAQYAALAEKALSFHPKFVVVGLNIGRNIFNTYDVVYGLDSWKQYRSSGFENDKPRTGDELKDISVNFKSWRDYLHEHSKIYGFLSENTRVLREKLGLASPFMTGTSDWSNADPDAALLYDKIPSQKTLFWANTVLRSVDMEDKNIVEGLRLNNILLDELNKKILEGGSTLIVSIIPSKELVYEARIEEAGLRNPYFEKLVTGQQSIRKSILSSCEENNIFCFDMLPYLRGALDDGEVIYMPSVNMHPTSHGYEIFAKGVAEKLNAENIMKNETPLNKQHDE